MLCVCGQLKENKDTIEILENYIEREQETQLRAVTPCKKWYPTINANVALCQFSQSIRNAFGKL